MERPFPINPTLTAIAIAYKNPAVNLIHDRVLPEVSVLSERFSWLDYLVAEAFSVPELQVGRKSQPGQVEFTAKEVEGRIKHCALDDVIPITDIDEAKAARQAKTSKYDPETAATEGLTNIINMGRELRAAKVV